MTASPSTRSKIAYATAQIDSEQIDSEQLDIETEVDEFLARIEAGVVYVNRRAGATTGAWAGAQPFGGWKGPTATGRGSGGYYYVQQFMREQSRTIVD